MQVKYLNIVEKHTFYMPNFSFKPYNNIFVPSWVEFDFSLGIQRGMEEENSQLSNKVSMLWTSSPSSSF